ncbi:MAG: CHAT domain-containing protein [Acidobacteria bacterium]|nr:CHAT domain-containing protein [Acidobacteriota bacterium]
MNIQKVQVVLCLAVLWLQLVGPVSLVIRAQSPTSPISLSMGKPIEKELKAGETHRYTLDLSAGEFVHLVVEQKAIDVVVMVIDPAGNQVVQVNYFDRMYGPEPVFWIAAQSGVFEVQVVPYHPSPTAGKYNLELRTHRMATDPDRECIRALDLIKQAEALLRQEQKESTLEGLNRYQVATDLFHSLGYTWMEATSLYFTGATCALSGKRNRGIELYLAARELYRTAGDEEEVALMNFTIGSNYAGMRMYSEGIPYLMKVVEYGQQSNQVLWEAYAQSELGSLYEDSGDSEKSFEGFNRALYLARQGQDQFIEAQSLARLSRHYKTYGDDQRALNYIQQAQDIFGRLGNIEGENLTTSVLAWMYTMDGRHEKALELRQERLARQQSQHNPVDQFSLLTGCGSSCMRLKKFDQALEYFTQSLVEIRKVDSPALIAISLSNIASTYFSMKNHEKALEYYFQVLKLTKELNEPEYGTLIYIAQAYHSLGNLSRAREYYQLAIENRRILKQTFGLYDCYNRFAKFEYKVGNLQEAKKLLEAAIEAVEQVRSGYVTPQNRALFFTLSQNTYDLLVDVLFSLHEKDPSAGHIAEAFLVSEKRRARSLNEQLAESKLPAATNVPPELLARRDTLAQTIATKTEAVLPLLKDNLDGKKAQLPEENPERVKAQQELDVLAKELELVETEIRKANPAFANLTAPQPLSASQVQAQILDADTQLVSYQLGEERSFAWVISKDRIDGFVLPKRTEIETAVRTFVNHVTGKNEGGSTPGSVKAAGKIVSDLIVKPLASRLTAKRLIIIPDGALFYLPFGALPAQVKAVQSKPNPTPEYLIEQFELVFEPSASTLAVVRETFKNRSQRDQTAFVVANPVFSPTDDRFKSTVRKQPTSKPETVQFRTYQEERLLSVVGDTWTPIPGTSEQARVIQQLAGPNHCQVIEGFQASKKRLTETDLSPFRIVHFATHGRFDSTRPEFSGLVLSLVDEQAQKQEGYLLSNEIYDLKLNADLVVLSACESGLGKELKGEGVIGLTRAFMYAGSPRVIATLWSVPDSSTAELVKRFYQHLLSKTNPLPPAQALRTAQIEMLKDKKNLRWRIPFHWAAFQLQGEYR